MELNRDYRTSGDFPPENWDIRSLREIVDFENGRPHEGDVQADGKFWLITLDSIDIYGNLKSDHKRTNFIDSSLRKGDIVSVLSDLAHGNLLGLCDVIPQDNAYVLNQRMGRLRVKESGDPSFIRYQINSRQGYFKKRGQGTSQRHVYKRDFYELEIPFPNLTEQHMVAEALSDADKLIESLEQLMDKKRMIKQGVVQELLKPTKDWATYEVGNIADPTKQWSFTGGPFGSDLKSSDYTTEGVRIIQLQNIGDGVFKDDNKIFTSFTKADELMSNNIFPGDIILSKMGDPVARACIIPSSSSRYLMCSDGIRLAVDPKRFNPYFVYILLNTPFFRMTADNASSGSTRKRIGLLTLRKLQVQLPSLVEQNKIADLIMAINSEIVLIENYVFKMKQIKQGMMHLLLTGRIRLLRENEGNFQP